MKAIRKFLGKLFGAPKPPTVKPDDAMPRASAVEILVGRATSRVRKTARDALAVYHLSIYPITGYFNTAAKFPMGYDKSAAKRTAGDRLARRFADCDAKQLGQHRDRAAFRKARCLALAAGVKIDGLKKLLVQRAEQFDEVLIAACAEINNRVSPEGLLRAVRWMPPQSRAKLLRRWGSFRADDTDPAHQAQRAAAAIAVAM